MKHILGPNSKSKITFTNTADVQPNAVDLRLNRVLMLRPKAFIISEDDKTHRGNSELFPDANGWYQLGIGTYEVTMFNVITVAENEAGWVVTRSSLTRNGVFLSGGLYDSGFSGTVGATLHVTTAPMRIQLGTRIGQYISFNAETMHMYDGQYGLGKPGDEKYTGSVAEDVSSIAPATNVLELTKADIITEEQMLLIYNNSKKEGRAIAAATITTDRQIPSLELTPHNSHDIINKFTSKFKRNGELKKKPGRKPEIKEEAAQ